MRDEGTHGTLGGFTDRQLDDLAAFVLSIDGDLTAAEVRAARDSAPPRALRAEAWALTAVDVFFDETLDRASAEDPANWTVLDATGAEIPVTAAVLDPRRGDRVTLTTSLVAGTDAAPRRYTVVPGAVLDAAATVTGGVANALDTADARNRLDVAVGATLTVTLGASGRENLTVVVHDSAFSGANLSTWNHDHVSLFRTGGRQNKGFVRFEWRDAFAAGTGITDAARIEEASVTLTPELGNTGTLEARRCLQSWRDSDPDKDWNRSANGSPTWRAHAHPNARWNQDGAERRTAGVEGDDPADYDGPNDTAFTPDAVAAMPSITDPLVIGGSGVRDAFRFWFENPAQDYGYCLQLPDGSTIAAVFKRTEREGGAAGPRLTIRYRVAD